MANKNYFLVAKSPNAVYHKPINTLRHQLTHVKDHTHPLQQCGAIYHVQCNDCPHNYIGETARPLQTRLQEHQSRPSSAIYEHIHATGHSITPEDTKILTTEPHTTKRKVKEAIHIKMRRPSLNRDSGSDLPSVYTPVLTSAHTVYAPPSLDQVGQPPTTAEHQAEEGRLTLPKYSN